MNKIWTLKSINPPGKALGRKFILVYLWVVLKREKTSMKHLVAGAGVPSFNNASSHFFTSFGNGLLLYPTHHLATLQIMFYIHEGVMCSHLLLSRC